MPEAKSSGERDAEICIIGAGPAGSVTALCLARLGYGVLLVDRPRDARQRRAESLPLSIAPILASLGLGPCLDRATFREDGSALIAWESDAVQPQAWARGHLIDRTMFDNLLCEAAVSAGARVVAPAQARQVQRLAEGSWRLQLLGPHGPHWARSRFLIDARGRRSAGTKEMSTPTAAVTGAWSAGGGFYQTRIEAGSSEWFWGSPSPDGTYQATVFLDRERMRGLATAARVHLYRERLATSQLLRGLLRQKPANLPRSSDATSRVHSDLAGADYIRVGEAAFAIDPLSSHGVQAAVLSAVQASAVVHTMLARPGDQTIALDFYRRHQTVAAARSRAISARYYALRAQRTAEPFWLRRSQEVPLTAPREQRLPRPASGQSSLGISPALRLVDTPVLSGSFVTLARALSLPTLESPVAYLGDFPLAPLIETIEGQATIDQILQGWARHVPPAAAARIMDWMWETGILVAA
jgi:flavin-dependent dehydrogenase